MQSLMFGQVLTGAALLATLAFAGGDRVAAAASAAHVRTCAAGDSELVLSRPFSRLAGARLHDHLGETPYIVRDLYVLPDGSAEALILEARDGRAYLLDTAYAGIAWKGEGALLVYTTFEHDALAHRIVPASRDALSGLAGVSTASLTGATVFDGRGAPAGEVCDVEMAVASLSISDFGVVERSVGTFALAFGRLDLARSADGLAADIERPAVPLLTASLATS